MPGGQKGTTRYQTRYRLPLLRLAVETYELAQLSPKWSTSRRKALRQAAAEVYKCEHLSLINPPKRERFMRKNPTCETYEKLVFTYLNKLVGQAMIENRDPGQILQNIEFAIRDRREEWCPETADMVDMSVHHMTPDMVDMSVHHPEPENHQFVHTPPESCMDTPQASPCDSQGPESHALESQGGMDAALDRVGAEINQVIFKNDMTKQKESAHPMTLEELSAQLPELIAEAERGGVSVIVCINGPFLQLDDCDAEAVKLLSPFGFITVETSANNYQVWFAFKTEEDKAAARDRLFAQLKNLAPGVNPGANGAMRWPGSINFKPGRNQWRVRIHSVNYGRIVTLSELDDAGLLADPEPQAFEWNPEGPAGNWPDYQRCLESKTVEGHADRSAADAQIVCFALMRRRRPEETSG